MHCPSCVVFIEEELRTRDGVSSVSASLAERTVRVEGDFSHEPDLLAEILTKHVSSAGYSLSIERAPGEAGKNAAKAKEFLYALPIAFALVIGFIALQNAGFTNLIGGGALSYGTAALVGVVASLSTCLAVVGGLVISVSATYAKEGKEWRPQAIFHAGRLIGFFALGGVIATLGKSLPWSAANGFVLTVLVSLVMLMLGLNLLDVFTRFQVRAPKSFARGVFLVKEKISSRLLPFLLGGLTFFLPCGFTQSMQLYALGSGDFWTGAYIMFFFALGTFPVLALLSFTGLTLHGKRWTGVFFKTAGFVVIALSVFNIWSALAAQGIVPPLGF